MSFARRVDRNHELITRTLRSCGWLVADTSRLSKFVDLVAQKHGRTVLIEVKDGAKAKHTTAQKAMAKDGWSVVTVRSVEDAVNL